MLLMQRMWGHPKLMVLTILKCFMLDVEGTQGASLNLWFESFLDITWFDLLHSM
jgi:hypothetical protein